MAAETGAANSSGTLAAMSGRETRPGGRSAHPLRALSPTECFDRLEPGGIGRVGFASAEGVVMLPVNYAISSKSVIFRTAPDTLLALYADAHLSFEVDDFDYELREGWSVLVQGHAQQVTDEREVRYLEETTRLQPWAAGPRDVYVRIAPIRITGRCIQG